MLSKSDFFKSYFLCLSASYYQYFALPLLLRRKPLKRSTSYRPCRSIVYWFNDLPFQCSFVFIRMLRRFFQPHNFCQNHSVSDRSLFKRSICECKNSQKFERGPYKRTKLTLDSVKIMICQANTCRLLSKRLHSENKQQKDKTFPR